MGFHMPCAVKSIVRVIAMYVCKLLIVQKKRKKIQLQTLSKAGHTY